MICKKCGKIATYDKIQTNLGFGYYSEIEFLDCGNCGNYEADERIYEENTDDDF